MQLDENKVTEIFFIRDEFNKNFNKDKAPVCYIAASISGFFDTDIFSSAGGAEIAVIDVFQRLEYIRLFEL